MNEGKIDKIKKLKNGKIAVKWQGKRKYVIINDDRITQYLIYIVANGLHS